MERLRRLEQRQQDQWDRFETSHTEVRRAAATSEQQVGALASQVQQLTTALGQLTAAATPAPATPAERRGGDQILEPRVATPERYDGDAKAQLAKIARARSGPSTTKTLGQSSA